MAVRIARPEEQSLLSLGVGHGVLDTTGVPLNHIPSLQRLEQLIHALSQKSSIYADYHHACKRDILEHTQLLYSFIKSQVKQQKNSNQQQFINVACCKIIAGQRYKSAADPRLVNILEKGLPNRPYSCNDFPGNRKKPLSQALADQNIQLNPDGFISFLIVDYDRIDTLVACEHAGLPPPTWIAQSKSGRGHIVWALNENDRVYTGGCNQRPALLASDITTAFALTLDADLAYCGLLSKNPIHPKWNVSSPSGYATYNLSYLAEFADFAAVKEHKSEQTKKFTTNCYKAALGDFTGRNILLFDEVRHAAYKAVSDCINSYQLLAFTTDLATKLNKGFATQLSDQEVLPVARSIARWTWSHRTHFAPSKSLQERQQASRIKAAKAVQVRVAKNVTKALNLRAQGLTQAQISDRLKVSTRTIRTWLNTPPASKAKRT